MENKTLVVVNRNGKAVVYNGENKKHYTVSDESTSMASIKAIISIMESLDKDNDFVTTIVLPVNLNILLSPKVIDTLIRNGYKSSDGTKTFTKEYLDSLKYISDLKAYLGTRVCQYRKYDSELLSKEQIQYRREAWQVMDKIEKPAEKVKPVRPNGLNIKVYNNIM